jgi:2-amino-4-hydroxy-6-hydroxymethyldihydropteridine diphosphokinase
VGHSAYIGLGSNLGDRQAAIRAAADLLRAAQGVQALRLSSFLETDPVGGPPGQGRYLNAAARLETTLDPSALLELLLATERALGRHRSERWGPRTIDLDLLLFDQQTLHTPTLTIPHPRMHERRFVLEPLAEIAPDAVHPTLNRTIRRLLDDLNRPAQTPHRPAR